MIKDDSLPEGWSSALDPTYNHVYYFNVSTGQRTWEKPAAAPKTSKAEPPAQVKPLFGRALPCPDLHEGCIMSDGSGSLGQRNSQQSPEAA